MGKNSAIEWTDHTFNAWIGCEKISPACTNCYAAEWAKRFKKDVWGKGAPRLFTKESYWMEPHVWDLEAQRAGVRRRVFVNSMSDTFEAREDLNPRREMLWDLIESCPFLDWLLLTKRPENILRMIPREWLKEPPPNVWYGTTVENQEQAEKRIPELQQVPARVRFLSCEPLLGPLDLSVHLKAALLEQSGEPFVDDRGPAVPMRCIEAAPLIHWIIVGGESGEAARPMYHEWPRAIRDQAVAAGVPFFFKQWGSWAPVGDLDIDANDAKLYHPAPARDPEATRRPRVRTVVLDAQGPTTTFGPGAALYFKVGKRVAGRMLAGRTWDEFPKTQTGKETR